MLLLVITNRVAITFLLHVHAGAAQLRFIYEAVAGARTLLRH